MVVLVEAKSKLGSFSSLNPDSSETSYRHSPKIHSTRTLFYKRYNTVAAQQASCYRYGCYCYYVFHCYIYIPPTPGTCYTPALDNLPKCRLCNMQADPQLAAKHENSRFCREGRERIVQTNAAIANQRALEVGFTAYGEDLERVEVFKYLGRLMAMDDTDTQAIRDNLSKARKVWKMIHRLLSGENMAPRVC
eukprot:scaffold29926_cov138-Skeletonema_marinoi.AAC.1